MTGQSPVPKDHPLMKAWEAYKATPDFGNSKQWAAHPEHLLGSLWAVFNAGWNAGTAAAFGMEVIAGPAPEASLVDGVAPTAERELFEEWSRSRPDGGFTLDRYSDPACTDYIHWGTQLAWESWQASAARGAQEVMLPPTRESDPAAPEGAPSAVGNSIGMECIAPPSGTTAIATPEDLLAAYQLLLKSKFPPPGLVRVIRPDGTLTLSPVPEGGWIQGESEAPASQEGPSGRTPGVPEVPRG